MTTVTKIIEELKRLGTESVKKVLRNHGVQEPLFGVKIGDLKKIQKRIKKDYQLALDLYETGVYDAMYLAGLIADDASTSRRCGSADSSARNAPRRSAERSSFYHFLPVDPTRRITDSWTSRLVLLSPVMKSPKPALSGPMCGGCGSPPMG